MLKTASYIIIREEKPNYSHAAVTFYWIKTVYLFMPHLEGHFVTFSEVITSFASHHVSCGDKEKPIT